MVGLELSNTEPHGFDCGRRDRLQKGIGYRFVNRETADVEAVLPASVDEVFAGAVITRDRVAAAIMNMQPAATMPATHEALQQCRPLSHRAPRLMWLRPGVGIESRL